MVRVFASRTPSSLLSVMKVSSFDEGLLSSGTSPSAMMILTENRNRSCSVLLGTGGLRFSTSVILSACIWLYILSNSLRAASTLLSLTQDSGWKLNGSTFFSPVMASCRAFSSQAEDFWGWM